MMVEYLLGRRHVASLGGRGTAFRSPWRRGTFGLHSDAVQALKEAGPCREPADWDRVLIDGEAHRY